jgi:DNA-binding NarL/FixJ family response regulator
MMKVAIVDDHPLVREGIRNVLLKSDLDTQIVGEASSAAELLNILAKKSPNIVLLDITLTDRNGIDILHDLKKMFPELAILVLSMHPEQHYALRALKAGASGYLNKCAVHSELVRAIRVIVKEKKRYISAAVAQELAAQLTDGIETSPHRKLSDREYQVLLLIAIGKKVSDIADILSLSVQTIHTYRTRIKDKMNMDSNAELIRYALEHQLVD